MWLRPIWLLIGAWKLLGQELAICKAADFPELDLGPVSSLRCSHVCVGVVVFIKMKCLLTKDLEYKSDKLSGCGTVGWRRHRNRGRTGV